MLGCSLVLFHTPFPLCLFWGKFGWASRSAGIRMELWEGIHTVPRNEHLRIVALPLLHMHLGVDFCDGWKCCLEVFFLTG